MGRMGRMGPIGPVGESRLANWGGRDGPSRLISSRATPIPSASNTALGDTDVPAPDGDLEVSPFSLRARPPRPAAALSPVNPWRRLVAAQPDRHDGRVRDRLQQPA